VFRLAAIALLALLAGAAYGQSCAPRESLEKAVMDSRIMRWQELSKGYGWEAVSAPGQSAGD
jgi:hypothetical protein